ncbi:hypothetical protein RRG08_043999 [Elysia crispata]|uniref:Uncharacterized protein n=1 Tax=Elysia crispata TaxID=231223 RepID=A0AAE0Y2E4_9GAST|nr:hypothetical protein RRG08_043999 [Elysia crispata]
MLRHVIDPVGGCECIKSCRSPRSVPESPYIHADHGPWDNPETTTENMSSRWPLTFGVWLSSAALVTTSCSQPFVSAEWSGRPDKPEENTSSCVYTRDERKVRFLSLLGLDGKINAYFVQIARKLGKTVPDGRFGSARLLVQTLL